MNNKVIEVLDYMGEKFGIAIDWTEENVMPQVTEFMNRYQIYAIVQCALWIALSLTIAIIAYSLAKKIWKDIRNRNEKSCWYEMWNDRYDDAAQVLIVVIMCLLIGATVGFTIAAICNIFAIAEWSIVPEMKFLKTFYGMLTQNNG